MANETLNFLTESATAVKKAGIDLNNPLDFVKMIRNKSAWDVYATSLAEGIDEVSKPDFNTLMETARIQLMENSMYNFNPYETLIPGILRKFFPKLIAKALVNVEPIDKPDVMKTFVHARFGNYSDSAAGNYPYEFPYVNDNRWDGEALTKNDLTLGPTVGMNLAVSTELKSYDMIDAAGLQRSQAISIDKSFLITGVEDSTSAIAWVVYPDVDGNFFAEITLNDGTTDRLTGHIDYLNGILNWESVAGNIDKVAFNATVSLEENKINSKIMFTTEKLRFEMRMRQIQGQWTIPMEQDLRALYSLNVQSELINMMGEQMAIEIDQEMIDDIINAVYSSDATGRRQATFDLNPPDSYVWGRTNWYNNIQIPLSALSAEIYAANLMDQGNIIAANPVDAAVFESFQDFKFEGTGTPGGRIGYGTYSIQGGRWTILTSTLVPRGKMIQMYKSDDAQRATYVYSPYQMSILSPFPIANNPNLTIMSRYAKRMIRPESIALLSVTDSGQFHVYGHGA